MPYSDNEYFITGRNFRQEKVGLYSNQNVIFDDILLWQFLLYLPVKIKHCTLRAYLEQKG